MMESYQEPIETKSDRDYGRFMESRALDAFQNWYKAPEIQADLKELYHWNCIVMAADSDRVRAGVLIKRLEAFREDLCNDVSWDWDENHCIEAHDAVLTLDCVLNEMGDDE